MKKAVFTLFIILVSMNAFAFVDKNTATVRVLNKAAGKTQTITLPVGRTMSHEKLNLTVHSCKQTDPFQSEDDFMFIEISRDEQIFSGWMSKNEPGDNPLQDADYDLWLVKCGE